MLYSKFKNKRQHFSLTESILTKTVQLKPPKVHYQSANSNGKMYPPYILRNMTDAGECAFGSECAPQVQQVVSVCGMWVSVCMSGGGINKCSFQLQHQSPTHAASSESNPSITFPDTVFHMSADGSHTGANFTLWVRRVVLGGWMS